jgi:hypothetical protein
MEVFDRTFYEEKGVPDGSQGSVQPPTPQAEAHRIPDGASFTFGSTPELRKAPSWLVEARKRALANFALKNQDSSQAE